MSMIEAAQSQTLERLDNKLDEVETLVLELGLSKNQQVYLVSKVYDMWRDIKSSVEIEARCRAYEQRIGADDEDLSMYWHGYDLIQQETV
jgi:hypothetical protein